MKHFWKIFLLIFALSTVAVGSYVIPDLGVTTRKLAAKAVTAAKIADATITNVQVFSNTLTGNEITPSVNLPGNAVQENGKNVVVSSTNAATSLKIVRGSLNSGGGIISGEGFSVSHTLTGQYNISFTSTFASAPSVTMSPDTGSATGAGYSSLSSSAVNVIIYSSSTLAVTNGPFSFIAIGPR